MQSAHLLLAGIWVGSVWMAAFWTLDVPARTARHATDADEWVRALSDTDGWTLAGIVLTGVLDLWREAVSSAHLLGTTSGTALLVKLSLVRVVANLGAFNRFWSQPHGSESSEPALGHDMSNRWSIPVVSGSFDRQRPRSEH